MAKLRAAPALADLTSDTPLETRHDWSDEGFVVLPGMLPEPLMAAYETEWQDAHGPAETAAEWATARKGGWPDPVPYTRHPALADLCCAPGLGEVLALLVGEPAGVHLNLTGWESTQRNWHQDGYLNPGHVGDYYAAVWMALDTIHPDSGPFQCVPGSHRWPVVTQDRIGEHYDLTDPRWPTLSEGLLTPLFEAEIAARDADVFTYLPTRGDVMVWSPRLVHRGSPPNVPGMQRRAVISHYSGISHRSDMPTAVRHGDGWVFPLADRVNVPVR